MTALVLTQDIIDDEIEARTRANDVSARTIAVPDTPAWWESLDKSGLQTATTALEQVLAEHGIKHPLVTVQAAQLANIELAQLCAVLILETSGGWGEFGNDPGNPINGSTHRWVTEPLYEEMVRYVGEGYPSQGVSSCQLTSRSIQETADKFGGCANLLPNQHIGGVLLRQLIVADGVELGFQHYNGAGPAAVTYGKRGAEITEDFLGWIHDAL
jgi:hypothetical protein